MHRKSVVKSNISSNYYKKLSSINKTNSFKENKIEKDNKMLLTKFVSINSRINVNKIIYKGF